MRRDVVVNDQQVVVVKQGVTYQRKKRNFADDQRTQKDVVNNLNV